MCWGDASQGEGAARDVGWHALVWKKTRGSEERGRQEGRRGARDGVARWRAGGGGRTVTGESKESGRRDQEPRLKTRLAE